MRVALRSWCLFLMGALLAGCTTPGVRVERATSWDVPANTTLTVVGDDSGSAWAAREALRSRCWSVDEAGGTTEGWTLRTYTTVQVEGRRQSDPFCDPWRWAPPGWGMWDPWGRVYGPCWSARDRWDIYPVRTVAWALEDPQHRLAWYASARERRPAGPPVALSDKLAGALAQWRAQNLTADPWSSHPE